MQGGTLCCMYVHMNPITNACNFPPPFFRRFFYVLRCDSPYVWIGCISTEVLICMYITDTLYPNGLRGI